MKISAHKWCDHQVVGLDLGPRSKIRKLTLNYGEKKDITSLWPWSSIEGHQFQYGSSQSSKQLYSENCVQICISDHIRSAGILFTDRQTHTYKQTVLPIHDFVEMLKNITPHTLRDWNWYFSLFRIGSRNNIGLGRVKKK